jgi:1-acyl-sn-glycerol-3-phosphate acyltransferase
LLIARFLYDAGRIPRFMAKIEVFRIPVLGRLIRRCGQIPVYRYSENAVAALHDAVAALERGECVVIYPEGTVTKDPSYWPMRARTGVARLALTTGAPVVPVAQWGAQYLLGRDMKPHLFPRKVVSFAAGPPVDLSAYAGASQSAAVLREATDHIMGHIRELCAELREQPAPAVVFDPRTIAAVADDDELRSA